MSPKVAIVTGANKGLGFALVKELCKNLEGEVYLTSRDEARGMKACEELNKANLRPIFHQLDVTDEKSVGRFCDHLRKNHGKIDILINNAGVLFLKDSKEPILIQADETIRVNFTSLANFTETILPLISNGGTILNISSSSGHLSRIPSEESRKKFSSENLDLEELKGLVKEYLEDMRCCKEVEKLWGESPYVVSKVAVNAYTFLLNKRLRNLDIKVNCVHPGYVISDMTKGAGNITPGDAAKVPVQLALKPEGGGQYVWHNGERVPWDGPDPRGYIDEKF